LNQLNQEIDDFLNYYYNLPSAPEYAVMLKGKWGSGKTWFIRRTIEKFESYGGKVLYVSLYGVSDHQQIEQEFFRQLHPVLGSKGAALAGKLFKGLVKGTLKIDLNGDSKDDGALNVGVPEINIPEYLKDTKGFVLVFDDLERCSLPISDLLGYINYFVEHDGYKVIIVANEDEILAQEDENESATAYRRIKEKLIGKTFEITPDLDGAIAAFLNEIESTAQQRILRKNTKLIQELYSASGYRNLRHLRQAILDFARLLSVLDGEALKSENLLTHLLSMFLLYSFEIKSGSLRPEDIGKIRTSYYATIVEKNGGATPYKILAKKYAGTDIMDELLPSRLWEDIFSTGLFNSAEINKALLHSKYFISKNQPDWVELWNAHSLADDELDVLLPAVVNRFQNNEYTQLGVLRHVVGTLLMLSEIGILNKAKGEILSIAQTNLKKMKDDGILQKEFSGELDFLRGTGFAGMAFHHRETKEFQEFSAQIEVLGKEAVEASYPYKATELLNLMALNTRDFCRSLILSNDYMGPRYYDTPILKYILPADFVKAFESLSPDQMSLVSGTINERYSLDYSKAKLQSELPWLLEVAPLLREAQAKRTGKMSGVHIGYVAKSFESAIASLNLL
jgi:hypothetical protein